MGPGGASPTMTLDPKTILQILVLAVGAHIVLSFLRTTRGSGLVRGVVIALVVVFGGLLGVARWLELAELQYILETLTGFVVVILAIVFQPELRRGIVSLGDNPLLRTVIGSRGGDVVDEVAAACVSMAKLKQGALIAFERRMALDTWTQKAVKVDARVSRHLLESIFHPGGALHDGAVIVREGRVAAAMAILPLSERENLARSIGTRHRAALGLAEETDAIVVAVSEETGLITVCQDGAMERKVLKDELAADLRARLGGEESKVGSVGWGRRVGRALFAGLGQKALALAFGVGLFYAAFRSVRTTRDFTVEVRVEAGEAARSRPSRGVLRIVLPEGDLFLQRPLVGSTLSVRATAPQAVLAGLEGGIGGVLLVDESWVGTERQVDLGRIRWGQDRVVEDLDVSLAGEGALTLAVERYASTSFTPRLTALGEADEGGVPARVGAPTGLAVAPDSLEFTPGAVTLRGPADAIAAVEDELDALRFQPVEVAETGGGGFVVRLRLDPSTSRGVELGEELYLRGRLVAPERSLGSLELDVALVSFDPTRPGLAAEYDPPTGKITARVMATRLLDPDLPDETRTARRQAILAYVRTQARVFVDVSRIDPQVSLRAPVEVDGLDRWRVDLAATLPKAAKDRLASLRLEFDEQDSTLELRPRR